MNWQPFMNNVYVMFFLSVFIKSSLLIENSIDKGKWGNKNNAIMILPCFLNSGIISKHTFLNLATDYETSYFIRKPKTSQRENNHNNNNSHEFSPILNFAKSKHQTILITLMHSTSLFEGFEED